MTLYRDRDRDRDEAGRNPKFLWLDAFCKSGIRPYSTAFLGATMANRDNGDGKGFYISAASLAEMGGTNFSTAERAIKKLMEEGWITRTKKGGRHGGQGRASAYQLSIPRVQHVGPDVLGVESPGPQHVRTDVLAGPEEDAQHLAPDVLGGSQHVTPEVPVDQLLPCRPEELHLTATRSRGSGEGRRSFGYRAAPPDEPPTRFIPKRTSS